MLGEQSVDRPGVLVFDDPERLAVGEGRCVERGGKYELAATYYEKAIRAHPDHLYAAENLVHVRIKTGRCNHNTLDLITRCLEEETRSQWASWLEHKRSTTKRCLTRTNRSLAPTSRPAKPMKPPSVPTTQPAGR